MSLDVNISDFFKLPTKIMFSLAVGTGIILFAPDTLVNKMYLINFRNNYGFILGLIFITTFSITAVSLFLAIYKYTKALRSSKKFKKLAKPMLEKLDTYQKHLVYQLYIQNNRTDVLPLHDGSVNVLEHNMMIQKATTQYAVSDLNNAVFPYFLQPWVVNELNKDEQLLATFERAHRSHRGAFNAEMSRRRTNDFW